MTEQQNGLDEANVAVAKASENLVKAQTIRQLVDGGFSHQSAVAAVTSSDLTVLVKG